MVSLAICLMWQISQMDFHFHLSRFSCDKASLFTIHLAYPVFDNTSIITLIHPLLQPSLNIVIPLQPKSYANINKIIYIIYSSIVAYLCLLTALSTYLNAACILHANLEKYHVLLQKLVLYHQEHPNPLMILFPLYYLLNLLNTILYLSIHVIK